MEASTRSSGVGKPLDASRILEREISRLRAPYADYRLVRSQRLFDRTKEGRLTESRTTDCWGAGIRILRGGSVGFASTQTLTPLALKSAVHRCWEMAGSAATLRASLRSAPDALSPDRPVSEIEMASQASVRGSWHTPISKDPWRMLPRERTESLRQAESWLKAQEGLDRTRGELQFARKEVLFWSSQGSRTSQVLDRAGGWLVAEAHSGCERVIRSWPGPSGCFRGGGFEVIERMPFGREAERLARELAELVKSPRAPVGVFDLVLKNSVLALQLHETFGHGLEADRLYGYEDNFGGSTYLDTGLIASAEIAARCVSVVSDSRPQQVGGTGTFAYDDEGVPARRVELIRKGVLQGFLSSREMAWFLNAPQSSGNMVAQDGCFLPLVRMTNLNLLPGSGTEKDLVADIEEGLLLDAERSWSIDEVRLGFQIGAECGYRIRNGRVAGMVREPFYHGNSLDFWKSCDAIAGREAWMLWGFPDCRKGAPYQDIFCSHGIAPARFRRVAVGREL